MITMQIEVSSVSPVRIEGKFPKMDINYVRDGKNNNRTLAGVGKTKEVITSLSKAVPGDTYDIVLEKSADDKFWNWISAEKTNKEAAVASPTKSSYQTKSTYETPEERARKQVYIIRQSSLSNAIEYLTAQQKKYELKEVLCIAETFVSFVFQTEGQATVDEVGLEDLKDDIPF